MTLLTAEFPSWPAVFGHHHLLHLLLTSLKHLKPDSTFCYEEVISQPQKVLKYLQTITWDNVRACKMFWICYKRRFNHYHYSPDRWCVDGELHGIPGYERQARVRQLKLSYRNQTDKLHLGPSQGRFKYAWKMNSISLCTCATRTVWPLGSQGKDNLTQKSVHARNPGSTSRATGRKSFYQDLNSTSTWIPTLLAHYHSWQSQDMLLVQ